MSNDGRNPIVLLLYFFLLSYSVSLLIYAADSIKQGESIKDGETMISNEENFELGFFGFANSTKRYVGIWYYKIPGQTVVWVANRDNPVLDSSGVFTLGNDGNLIVSDGNGRALWSSNRPDVQNNLTAILLDTGNLILARNEDENDTNKALWQSFDNPTDTFLPGMRLGLNSKIGFKHVYTSWRENNDPSTGNFSAGIDSLSSAQIVIWEGSKRLWRSGLWNAQTFIGVPSMRSMYLYGFRLIPSGPEEIYFTYSVANSSQFLRFLIRWDGIMEELQWDEAKQVWDSIWSQAISGCDVYSKCGTFGSCSMLKTPICSCPTGFIPKSNNEWSKRNWSSGCMRRTQLQCERDAAQVEGDGFLEVEGVKLPDFAQIRVQADDENKCEDECLRNCSCQAYAFVNGIGCTVWDRELVDIQRFQEGGNKIYIRLNDSELGSSSNTSKLVIILAVVLGTIFLSLFAYLLWRNRNKLQGLCKKENKEIAPLDSNKSKGKLREFSGEDIGEGEEEPGPLVFGYTMLETATNNFSASSRLGQGGFGDVYKGLLPCGQEVAVKRLSRMSGQGLEEFKTEVILIAKLQHRNLVRILGCCIEEEEKMLVYEYMPNKSLDAFIFDSTKQLLLDWPKRFNIIEGIARGLLYLHRDSRLRIIHRDLKASNILLDEEMNPKISDFGMAKIFGGNQNQANTNRVVGTYGYMSPEYAMEGLFSVKSDVYSFGVLLLEIVSGKKNSYFRYNEQYANLLAYAWDLWSEGKAMEFADPSIRNSCIPFEVCRCIHVALLCVQDSTIDRPTMSSVVLMLESESATLPIPKLPTFTIGRTPSQMDMSIEEHEIVSTNDVTVTVILGR